MIDRTGEHPRELGLAELRLEADDLRLGIGDRGGVVLGHAELEVTVGVGELLVELLNHVELLLDVGTLPEQGLRLGLIVPEVRRARLLVQLGKSSFELRDVKDAPLAPVGAASGPRAFDGCPRSW